MSPKDGKTQDCHIAVGDMEEDLVLELFVYKLFHRQSIQMDMVHILMNPKMMIFSMLLFLNLNLNCVFTLVFKHGTNGAKLQPPLFVSHSSKSLQ